MTAKSSATRLRISRLVPVVVLVVATIAVVAAARGMDDARCDVTAGAPNSETRPAHCAAVADPSAVAHIDQTTDERRPSNFEANHTRPTAEELERFRAANDFIPDDYATKVTGAYEGTTDDIIEWAAWKWGIDEDLLRAIAWHESNWLESARGDNGTSIGLLQIKRTFHHGTYPLTARSTAFNIDYYGAVFRYYYDGRAAWLNDEPHGRPYEAGDVWGSLGAHFAGRWYTPEAEAYMADVRRTLKHRLWTLPG